MKIILVSNTEWYLYNFRRALGLFLKARGWEVVMASPPGEYAKRLQALGFRWIQWDLGRKTLAPWKEIDAILEIARIYRREKPDLVHHNTIKPCIYGTLAARMAGVRGIVNAITGRGYVFLGNDAGARLLKPVAHALYRLAFSPHNCVAIFENAADQKYFLENQLISPARARLIESSGVDPDLFTPSPEPAGIPVILQASRMLWDKGVGVLVEAARILHERVPVRVALAGNPDPGNPASIPEAALRGWHEEGVIEWWGFQPDMNTAFGKSHIVTLPTMYAEGLPISLLEAAACGRPIVATPTPGCRDLIIEGYNGFLVPPNDPAALAGALEKLATDPGLRAKMGAAGRQRVLEKYTNALVNTATLSVYRALI
ncbi:MAG: glycosyltransferase family 4 protein [Anaerolineales bacterium]